VLELVILQFTDYIAVQYPVIKDKVCKIVFVIYDDSFLAGFKTEPFA